MLCAICSFQQCSYPINWHVPAIPHDDIVQPNCSTRIVCCNSGNLSLLLMPPVAKTVNIGLQFSLIHHFDFDVWSHGTMLVLCILEFIKNYIYNSIISCTLTEIIILKYRQTHGLAEMDSFYSVIICFVRWLAGCQRFNSTSDLLRARLYIGYISEYDQHTHRTCKILYSLKFVLTSFCVVLYNLTYNLNELCSMIFYSYIITIYMITYVYLIFVSFQAHRPGTTCDVTGRPRIRTTSVLELCCSMVTVSHGIYCMLCLGHDALRRCNDAITDMLLYLVWVLTRMAFWTLYLHLCSLYLANDDYITTYILKYVCTASFASKQQLCIICDMSTTVLKTIYSRYTSQMRKVITSFLTLYTTDEPAIIPHLPHCIYVTICYIIDYSYSGSLFKFRHLTIELYILLVNRTICLCNEYSMNLYELPYMIIYAPLILMSFQAHRLGTTYDVIGGLGTRSTSVPELWCLKRGTMAHGDFYMSCLCHDAPHSCSIVSQHLVWTLLRTVLWTYLSYCIYATICHIINYSYRGSKFKSRHPVIKLYISLVNGIIRLYNVYTMNLYEFLYMFIYAFFIFMSFQAHRPGTTCNVTGGPRTCSIPVPELCSSTCGTMAHGVLYMSCLCHDALLSCSVVFIHLVWMLMCAVHWTRHAQLFSLCLMNDDYVATYIITYFLITPIMSKPLLCFSHYMCFSMPNDMYSRHTVQMSNVTSTWLTLFTVYEFLLTPRLSYCIWVTICHITDHSFRGAMIKFRDLTTNLYILLFTWSIYSYSLYTMNFYVTDSRCSIYSRVLEFITPRLICSIRDAPHTLRSTETDTPHLGCPYGIPSILISDPPTTYQRGIFCKAHPIRLLVFLCTILGYVDWLSCDTQYLTHQFESPLHQFVAIYNLSIHSQDCNMLYAKVPGLHVSGLKSVCVCTTICTVCIYIYELYDRYIYIPWVSYE